MLSCSWRCHVHNKYSWHILIENIRIFIINNLWEQSCRTIYVFSELITVRNKTINFLFLSFFLPPSSQGLWWWRLLEFYCISFIRDSLWLATVAIANTKPMAQSDQTLKLRSDNSDRSADLLNPTDQSCIEK